MAKPRRRASHVARGSEEITLACLPTISATAQMTHARPRREWPLRVVRLIENEASGVAAGGRMRISGRMADVCAELERLAEREAAFQQAAIAT